MAHAAVVGTWTAEESQRTHVPASRWQGTQHRRGDPLARCGGWPGAGKIPSPSQERSRSAAHLSRITLMKTLPRLHFFAALLLVAGTFVAALRSADTVRSK